MGKSPYSENNGEEENYQYEVSTGQSLYQFEYIDYEFRDFPDEIDIPTGSKLTYKERLSLIDEYTAVEIIQLLTSEKRNNARDNFIKAKLRSGDHDTEFLYLSANILAADAFIEVASEFIEKRPVEVDWHRAYQEVLMSQRSIKFTISIADTFPRKRITAPLPICSDV